MVFLARSLALAIIFLALQTNEAKNTCSVYRCSARGPDIRFPFWTAAQPRHCGYPGFKLSCNGSNTVLQLPSYGEVLVTSISYTLNRLTIVGPRNCIEGLLLQFNSSATPFNYESMDPPYGHYVYAVDSSTQLGLLPQSCQRIHTLVVPYYFRHGYGYFDYDTPEIADEPYCFSRNYNSCLFLSWSVPGCEFGCLNCGFKSSTSNKTLCFDPYPPYNGGFIFDNNSGKSTKHLMIIGICTAFVFITVAIATMFSVYYFRKRGKEKEMENQMNVERFLEDYKSLGPKRYSYAHIKKITNHFKIKLGEGGYGSVFKGSLPNGQQVAVKVLKKDSRNDGREFINEVGTIGRVHHVNVVRLLGFCADGVRRALIYELMPNESLAKFISSVTVRRDSLSWGKLQDIAVGIARGMEYLHQGCNQRILHFDIKPHNILLDENFIPKISDFGLAKLCSKEHSAVSITAARGTIGYIAPEVLSRNFGNVSYKSDVYSFGMLLLEMVGERKNKNGIMDDTLALSMYNRLCQEEKTGQEIAGEEDASIARKLTIVALWCIQWYPVDRPSMKIVVQMLEGSMESLEMAPNPFAYMSTAPSIELANVPFPSHASNLHAISEEEEETKVE
ncbi:rust resistance kinase Lr10-like isoform X2 [Typha angustifolia]|uniref:rust resistance kinase Lr10-like isoform X2 n=1 Tax=Typha angustifolia TaxID=59011 RepID=UPI003C2B65CD